MPRAKALGNKVNLYTLILDGFIHEQVVLHQCAGGSKRPAGRLKITPSGLGIRQLAFIKAFYILAMHFDAIITEQK